MEVPWNSKRKYKIGISHGALKGVSPDMTDKYFKMSKDELKNLNMDLWLLGHTHLPYPFEEEITNRKIFNCGTPEPDGLDCSHFGNSWFIEIDNNKNIWRINIIITLLFLSLIFLGLSIIT